MVRNSASSLHPTEIPQVVYSNASLHPFSQCLVSFCKTLQASEDISKHQTQPGVGAR